MDIAILALNSLLLLNVIINLIWIPTPSPENGEPISASVDALVPLRNEEPNVEGVISSLSQQRGLSTFHVTALDDNSNDGTQAMLSDLAAPSFSWRKGLELPSGWLGKNFALHQLAKDSDAEYLVFVDADVRLEPWAINAAIHEMHRKKWDFITPYPRQIALTWLERVVQPLLQWSWFASLNLPLANRLNLPSMVVANGQFFIVKNRAYVAAGGHEKIRSEVLDDLELARTLVRAGFRGGVVDGSLVARCRMYSSTRELIDGYSKSQWRAFGGLFGSFIAALFLLVSSILPLLLSILGSNVALLALASIVLTRLLVAIKTRSIVITSLVHPFSALIWIALIKLSWWRKWNGSLAWKGRSL